MHSFLIMCPRHFRIEIKKREISKNEWISTVIIYFFFSNVWIWKESLYHSLLVLLEFKFLLIQFYVCMGMDDIKKIFIAAYRTFDYFVFLSFFFGLYLLFSASFDVICFWLSSSLTVTVPISYYHFPSYPHTLCHWGLTTFCSKSILYSHLLTLFPWKGATILRNHLIWSIFKICKNRLASILTMSDFMAS